MIAGYYIFTVVVSLLRGGAKYSSVIGINPCGVAGWMMLAVHLGASAFVSVKVAEYIKHAAEEGRSFGD